MVGTEIRAAHHFFQRFVGIHFLRVLRFRVLAAGQRLVGVKDPFQVIGFVLEDDGGEAFHPLGHFLSCLCRSVADVDVVPAKHFAAPAGNRQTSFLSGLGLATRGNDADIGINLERFSFFIKALHRDNIAR